MLLLIQCSYIVAIPVDIHNGRIGIKSKQQQNKNLAEKNGTTVQMKCSY